MASRSYCRRARLGHAGLALGLLLALGCGTRDVLPKNDLAHVTQLLAPEVEEPCPPPLTPAIPLPDRVRTVNDPEAPTRAITLAECVALALENGRVEGQRIRVFALDPAIAATDIEQSLSKFDANFNTSMTWSNIDEPVGIFPTFSETPGPFGTQQQRANFTSTLAKPLATGGVAGIQFNTDYALTNPPTATNPVYNPAVTVSFEQPLLQGFGVWVNQIRGSHPGGVLLPVGVGGGPGILISRLVFDQSRADFDRRVQDMLLAVEQAYWTLYSSFWNLYSREQGQRVAYESWYAGKRLLDAGRLTRQDLAAIEEQYFVFRGERLRALGNGGGFPGVLEAERQLRLLIGLPVEDGCRLIPADLPTMSPFEPCWTAAAQEAMIMRPELIRARQDVTTRELLLAAERNNLLPDLRFISNYNVNSIGTRLDGPSPLGALSNLGKNEFNDWTLGLRLNVPIGFRAAHAAVRRNELLLRRSQIALRDFEEQAAFALERSYRQVVESGELLRIAQGRLRAAREEFRLRTREFLSGLSITQIYLITQRKYADALRDERQSATDYNIALADFQRQKGTMLNYDNVTIGEGPLPRCAQDRASEHVRSRSHALQLVERPAVCIGPTLERPDLPGILAIEPGQCEMLTPPVRPPEETGPGEEVLPLPKLIDDGKPLPKTLPR